MFLRWALESEGSFLSLLSLTPKTNSKNTPSLITRIKPQPQPWQKVIFENNNNNNNNNNFLSKTEEWSRSSWINDQSFRSWSTLASWSFYLEKLRGEWGWGGMLKNHKHQGWNHGNDEKLELSNWDEACLLWCFTMIDLMWGKMFGRVINNFDSKMVLIFWHSYWQFGS